MSKASCKDGQKYDPFVRRVVVKEFVVDVKLGQELFPSNKAPRLLGAGVGGNAFGLVEICLGESRKEEIAGGRISDTCKGAGNCDG